MWTWRYSKVAEHSPVAVSGGKQTAGTLKHLNNLAEK